MKDGYNKRKPRKQEITFMSIERRRRDI